MRRFLAHRRFRLRLLSLIAVLLLSAGVFAALAVIRGGAVLKEPVPDYGQHLIRHMRYTYAEVAALNSLLKTLTVDAGDEAAYKLVVNAADHLFVRLQTLSGLKTGPISDPKSEVSRLARSLMEGMDRLVAAGTPMDRQAIKDVHAVSSALLRETGDYTRQVEMNIDSMLEQKKALTSTIWFEVIGGVLLLLLLSTTALALFLYNQRNVHQLKFANGHDSLTGLVNRRGFSDWIARTETIEPVRRHALVVFDLDRFKAVNDQLGHASGDLMLQAAADCLVDTFGARGIVARWGGDEFVVAVEYDPGDRADLENSIYALISDPPVIRAKGETIPINFSCGVALWPDHAPTIDEAMSRADAALYEAKGSGRGRFVFYHEGITARRKRVEAIRDDLGRALKEGEFFLEFQPQIDLAENRYIGAEALLRWRCSRTNRVLAPGEFIPIAEDSDQICDIDTFVLNEACRTAAGWARQHPGLNRIAVNVSPHSFQRIGLGAHILSILNRWNLAPNALEIEITEGVLLTDSEQLEANLADISQLGIRIALDDFGTGYSNIAYLARLKPDLLKIDRSFLEETNSHIRSSIIRGIVQLASTLDAETLIEGVETEDDLELAREAGCQLAQGFLFAKPMAADLIPQFRREFERHVAMANRPVPAMTRG